MRMIFIGKRVPGLRVVQGALLLLTILSEATPLATALPFAQFWAQRHGILCRHSQADDKVEA